MKAELATSTTRIPHNGRFIHCRSVTTKIFGIPDGATGLLKNKTVHLEIQRDGGPYLVLKMDKEGAVEIAKQMLELAEGIEPTTVLESAVGRRIQWLQKQIREQRAWIADHGGNEAGYIERYGNPGMEKCFGDGGSLIYAADLSALHDFERKAGATLTVPA